MENETQKGKRSYTLLALSVICAAVILPATGILAFTQLADRGWPPVSWSVFAAGCFFLSMIGVTAIVGFVVALLKVSDPKLRLLRKVIGLLPFIGLTVYLAAVFLDPYLT